jgi:hypothetical protein
MPNHTANNLTVSGPWSEIEKFLSVAKNRLSFNSFIPIPDEIRNTRSPVKIQSQQEIDEIWKNWNEKKAAGQLSKFEENRPYELGISLEQNKNLIEKYGTNNWYDWSIMNWGTKWDAYDVTEWKIEQLGDSSKASIYYETAWSPPIDFWVAVSKNYPDLVFYQEFSDEGGGFVGNITIQSEKVINSNDYDWDSKEGIDTLKRLNRYYPPEN